MEKNTNFIYKNLSPFKWFILENFPFLEADFDALTEWQLFCKIGKEINKIITSQNLVGEQAEELTNAFNDLQNYVNNYFENLDLQDEINNKLNEMAESGELTEIIAQYLQLAGLLCFNTVEDLKKANNIVDGSFVKTYGFHSLNDKGGAFYKIRKITNLDSPNNMDIIPLRDSSLIAELINQNVNVKTYGAYGDNIHDDTLSIQRCIDTNKKVVIPVGHFRISQIKLDSGNILVGESYNNSILYSIDNNDITDGLIVRKDKNTGWKLFINNLRIYGNKQNNTNIFDGVHFASNESTDLNSTLIDVNIEDFTGNGLTLINTSEVRCISVKCDENEKAGFNIQTSDCYFQTCTSNHNREQGMKFIYNSNKIVGCKCYFNGQGDGTTRDDLLDGLKRYAGIEISGGRNNIVSGCEFQDNWGPGIFVYYSSNNCIECCTCLNNGMLLDENGRNVSYESQGITQYIPECQLVQANKCIINLNIVNDAYSNLGYLAKWGLYIRGCKDSSILAKVTNEQNEVYFDVVTNCQITINDKNYHDIREFTPNWQMNGNKENLCFQKIGNIVHVSFSFSPSSKLEANTSEIILNNLPTPLVTNFVVGMSAYGSLPYRLLITKSGNLFTWYNSNEIPPNNPLIVDFVYFTN